MFGQKPILVGIDLQPPHLYLVALEKTRKKTSVKTLVRHDLPPNFRPESAENWEELQPILQEIVKQNGLSEYKTAIALPFELGRLNKVKVSSATTKVAIEREIDLVLERELKERGGPLCFDYQQKQRELDIMVVQESYLQHYIDCVKASGLLLRIVDLDLYALCRAFLFVSQLANVTERVAALKIIDNVAILIIYQQQEILLHQQISFHSYADISEWAYLKIKLYLSNNPRKEILPVLIFDEGIDLSLLTEKQVEIRNINLFHGFDVENKADFVANRMQQNHFIVAFGLALREVPLW